MPDPIPPQYDDLSHILATAFRLLAQGVADRRSPFHTPTVATVDDSTPNLRTVVLRAFDAQRRCVAFHTDARSPKAAALRAWPLAALHAYDPSEKVQIRIIGPATLYNQDAVANLAWEASTASAQRCYRVMEAPGQVLPAPNAVTETSDAAGRTVFTRVEIAIVRLEYLYLHSAGHRRARFTWTDGTLSSEWLAP